MKNIIIYPHTAFDITNDEVCVQYYLAKILSDIGNYVYICNIYDNNSGNVIYNTFIKIKKIKNSDLENTVVIYTEGVIGNPLCAQQVVRWVLGKCEEDIALDYYSSWGEKEMIYFLNPRKNISHENTKYIKYLSLFYVSPLVTKNLIVANNPLKKNNICYNNNDCLHTIPSYDEGSREITQLLNQSQWNQVLSTYKTFVSCSPSIFLNIVASLCGCISVISPIENVSKEDYYKMTALWKYMSKNNKTELCGIAYSSSVEEIAHATNTLHLAKVQLNNIQHWYINEYVRSFVKDIEVFSPTAANTGLHYKSFILNNIEHFYFDEEFYLQCNPDLHHLPNSYLSSHYEQYGRNEGRVATKQELIRIIDGGIFDINFYRYCNDDLNHFSCLELYQHYIYYGKKEGRIASRQELLKNVENPYFTFEGYKHWNKDLSHFSNYELIYHYKNYGKKEGRSFGEKTTHSFTPSLSKIYLKYNVDFLEDNITTKNKENEFDEFKNICIKKLETIRQFILPEFDKNSIYEAVLIDFKCQPHLEFLIRNTIIKLGEKWSHTVICCNLNFSYISNICAKISPFIKIINTSFNNDLTCEQLNTWIHSLDFWDSLKGDKILLYNAGSLIFKNNMNDFLKWDHIGENEIFPFSLQSKSAMIQQIINNNNNNNNNNIYDKSINDLTANKYTTLDFVSSTTLNKNSFAGNHFWVSDPQWRERIDTVFANEFDYALVFICHDVNSFTKVYKYLSYKNCYIVFVGSQPIDTIIKNEKIIIAKNYEDNIEHEAKLLTFTAWYLIIKNNLFTNYSHICLFEYDVTFKLEFLHNLNTIYKKHDIISFQGDTRYFTCDMNVNVFEDFLHIKNIDHYDTNSLWYGSTNHCIKREILENFVNWYYPECFYFKLYDYPKFSYYHERLFSVYIKLQQYNCYLFAPHSVTHFQKCSHRVFEETTETRMMLTYNDESGDYDEYFDKLVNSVKTHSDFQSTICCKKEIDPFFQTHYKSILKETKGGGCWLWKPYIILTTMNRLKEGDLLFYIDSKYYFVESFHSLYETPMNEKGQDILVWKNKPNEEITYLKNYCKMDVIQKCDANDIVFNQHAECCWAGAIVLRKTEFTVDVVKEWLRLCSVYENISDSPSLLANQPEYIDHRHDQALLSITLHKHNISFESFPTKYLQNVRQPW